MNSIINILQKDGLSLERLSCLSCKSELALSLKKNLHYFNRDSCPCQCSNQSAAFYGHPEDNDCLSLPDF